ncbi:MAG: glycosyl hydrolase [Parabacteroides sp.]
MRAIATNGNAVLTGTQNAPASPESTGYEIDKMSKAAASGHFDAYVGEIIRRIPPEKRKGFRHVVADSYEQGSETWMKETRRTVWKRIRIQSLSMDAGIDRAYRRKRRSFRPFFVGSAPVDCRPYCHRLCRRTS